MIGWLLRKIFGVPEAPKRASADTPGAATSEGKLTLINTVVAALLAVCAVFWPDLPRESIREVVLWIAGLMAAGSTGVYALTRAKVKTELQRTLTELELQRRENEALNKPMGTATVPAARTGGAPASDNPYYGPG